MFSHQKDANREKRGTFFCNAIKNRKHTLKGSRKIYKQAEGRKKESLKLH